MSLESAKDCAYNKVRDGFIDNMEISLNNLIDNKHHIADLFLETNLNFYSEILRKATSNFHLFRVVLKNYKLLKERGLIVPELEALTREQLAPFYVWLLETYCIGKGIDDVVVPVIKLHKRVIAGEVIEEREWNNHNNKIAAGCSTSKNAWEAVEEAWWYATWEAADAVVKDKDCAANYVVSDVELNTNNKPKTALNDDDDYATWCEVYYSTRYAIADKLYKHILNLIKNGK